MGYFAEGRRFGLLPKDRLFLVFFCKLLKPNIPREVRAAETLSPMHVVRGTALIGLADWAECFSFSFFSLKGNATAREALGELAKKQINFEAETLTTVIAFRFWLPRFANRKCILFVDYEGANFSLLRGLSDNLVVDFWGEQFVELEASMHAFTWLASVIQLQRGRCTVQGRHGWKTSLQCYRRFF